MVNHEFTSNWFYGKMVLPGVTGGKKNYQRDFEGMGEGLVLLKVESEVKNIGHNFHLFYRNGKKPPLDIAINPNDFSIEYVSFFLQDELIRVKNSISEIIYRDDNLVIYSEDFTIDNTNLNFQKDLMFFSLKTV